MNPVLSVALLLLWLAPAVPRYYIRYTFRAQGTAVTKDEVITQLEKGLFDDSLIVRGQPNAPRDYRTIDTSLAARQNRSSTVLAIIEVTSDTAAIDVSVTVKNVLAQTMAGPDNIRATRAGLDSALVESGRRLARRLASLARR